MHPILFEFSGFVLYTQTLLLGVAFFAGMLLALHEGQRMGLARVDIVDIVLWGFLSALLGARLMFLLLSWRTTELTWRTVCMLGTAGGGFSFHGGLMTSGLAIIVLTRLRWLPLWRLADALAPGLALALFFMRLGCLLNGCDYGVATTQPWGVHLHGTLRHPVQLYEGAGNLLLLPLLLWLNRRALPPGITALTYLLTSSLLRVAVDIYREESVRYWGHLTIPQMLSLAIALGAGIGGYLLLQSKKRPLPPSDSFHINS